MPILVSQLPPAVDLLPSNLFRAAPEINSNQKVWRKPEGDKGVAVLQFLIQIFGRFPRPDHAALCFAEIDALFEHSRLGRRAKSATT
jgi:hypothetical protein